MFTQTSSGRSARAHVDEVLPIALLRDVASAGPRASLEALAARRGDDRRARVGERHREPAPRPLDAPVTIATRSASGLAVSVDISSATLLA